MTEPTIICPNCKTEIKLTESLAAPLIESTRKQFEQQLAQKDSDIAKREQAMREKEKQLADAKTKLDEQVANQVEEQLKKDRARIVAEESKKAKLAAATDLEQRARELTDLQEVLRQRDEKLAEAQKAQAELLKKQRELDDAKRELELTVEKRVQEGLTTARDQAKREAEESLKLKVAEKDQTIAYMQQKIEELKRRAADGVVAGLDHDPAIVAGLLPGQIKPLVWTVNIPLVNTAWVRFLTELIGPNDIDPLQLARAFHYRAYFNMSVVGRVFEALGMPRETLELMMGVESRVRKSHATNPACGSGDTPAGCSGSSSTS